MNDLNELLLPNLLAELTRGGSVRRLLELAREEDLGEAGDVTTASIIDAEMIAEARLRAREAGVVAGLPLVGAVVEVFEADVTFEAMSGDGERCEAGKVLGVLRGPLQHLLPLERTLLNLLGRLCGIATLTRQYVEAVEGTKAAICETRKTTPGWRGLEKYAVRCGGATLHRIGLYDAALYKDNHLAHLPEEQWTEALAEAIHRARGQCELGFVEVEVDTLDQLDIVLGMDRRLVDIVLLDNMSLNELREAAARRDRCAPGMLLEASGGVTLETVRAIAETGVDRISVGALTHSAAALDVGLDVVGKAER